MAYLDWISDDELIKSVDQLVIVAKEALLQTDKDFNKNVIDPFSAIFQIAGFGMDYKNWIISEKGRQAQKTMQNQDIEY